MSAVARTAGGLTGAVFYVWPGLVLIAAFVVGAGYATWATVRSAQRVP